MKDTVARIKRMELCYDAVSQAAAADPALLSNDENIIAMLSALIDYQESGQWLKDYEADERGELPRKLKRGVLSQDGLYDLLSSINSD